MRSIHLALLLLPLFSVTDAANLTLFEEYSGTTFFDDWLFYGDTNVDVNGDPWNGVNPWDDLTSGSCSLLPHMRLTSVTCLL